MFLIRESYNWMAGRFDYIFVCDEKRFTFCVLITCLDGSKLLHAGCGSRQCKCNGVSWQGDAS